MSGETKTHPTWDAPDGGILRLIRALSYARPHAGKVNRWAALGTISEKTIAYLLAIC